MASWGFCRVSSSARCRSAASSPAPFIGARLAPAAARRRLEVALRAAVRAARRAHRRRRCWRAASSGRVPAAQAVRIPGRWARSTALRGAMLLGVRRAGHRVARRRGGAADAGRSRAAPRHPALDDAARAQREPAAVGPAPQRARALRPVPEHRRAGARRAAADPAHRPRPRRARGGRSVVRVLGTACGLGVEGSGWVAAPGWS